MKMNGKNQNSIIRNFPNFNSHPTLSRSYSQYVEDNAEYRYVTDFELSDQELFQFFHEK